MSVRVASLRPDRTRVRHLTRCTGGLACALLVALLPSAGASGQSAPATDPITGTWIGRIGPGTNPSNPVTLQLRAVGGEVGGTMTGLDQPGDVRRGSYDAATGAVRLELGITGQEGVQLILEGTVVQGTAIGRVTRGNQAGTFVLARASGSPAPSADASSATLPRDQLRGAFEEVSGHIAKAAELVPEGRYGYQPVGTVRTLGQLIGHIVDAYHYYCGRAAGRNAQWSDATAEGGLDKATLSARLRAATAQCVAAYASGAVGPLVVNTFHANLHYGNLVTYLRLLGLVPPSSG
ncbi:MAG TPA: DinB family protein [Gemmatimonadaceae bacterium]|nr:DinB family protein [Gemmatimonadaceae bacterium]